MLLTGACRYRVSVLAGTLFSAYIMRKYFSLPETHYFRAYRPKRSTSAPSQTQYLCAFQPRRCKMPLSLDCINVKGAMNPCRCGYYPDRKRCRCSLSELRQYMQKIPHTLLSKYCPLSPGDKRYMEETFEKLSLSARSYHRILRVARTIADMDGASQIKREHLYEAICYRTLDRRFWEGGA